MDINTNGISRAVQFVPGVSQPVVQGIPKSGRPWKAVQRARSSSQLRKGPLKHMSKSFEERRVKKIQMQEIKALEHELKENTKAKKEEKKAKIIEKRKLKMENEYKNTTYQVINPEKMKRMNKKQLRMIKKTSVNKDGTVEFVSPYAKIQDNSAHGRKIIDTSKTGSKGKSRR